MCILSTRYSQLASRIALVLFHSANVLLYGIVNRPSLFLFALENPELVSQKSSHAPLSLSLPRFLLVFAYQTSNARLELSPLSKFDREASPPLFRSLSPLIVIPLPTRGLSQKCLRFLFCRAFPSDTPHGLTYRKSASTDTRCKRNEFTDVPSRHAPVYCYHNTNQNFSVNPVITEHSLTNSVGSPSPWPR